MEKVLYIEPLQKRFSVEVKETSKAKRNRSYLNASDCCGAPLKEHKTCSSCNGGEGTAFQSGKTQRKIVKIGKAQHLVPAQAIEDAVDALANAEEITLHTFLSALPIDTADRIDGQMWLAPAEKKVGQYRELQDILKGRHAIGKFVLRRNEYEVIISVGDDGVLRLARLVDQPQMNDKPELNLQGVVVNQALVELENKILDRKMATMYDFTKFRDARSAAEEKLIEDVVLHGKVPEIKQQIVQQKEEDEMERLRKLAEEA